jgi:hypothetical protein
MTAVNDPDATHRERAPDQIQLVSDTPDMDELNSYSTVYNLRNTGRDRPGETPRLERGGGPTGWPLWETLGLVQWPACASYIGWPLELTLGRVRHAWNTRAVKLRVLRVQRLVLSPIP